VLLAPPLLAQEIAILGPLAPPPPETPPEIVSVKARPPARSASDWETDADTIAAVPHETGADVLGTLPGVYVSNRGLLGQAPHLSVRGFEGTSGQNMEVFLGNIPLNQISNIRSPGYADMRLVMPEVIRDVRIAHGPYDPHQGDFALAGTTRMDLGLDETGFVGKGTLGSFGSTRVLLAFQPAFENGDSEWHDSFAAFEAYSTSGPGQGRGGDRASFIGQLAFSNSQTKWRGIVAVGTARFDFPGMLSLADVEHGAYPYGAMSPLGRDLTSQAHLGNEFSWEIEGGVLTLGAYVSLTRMEMHENLTGYALDVLAGLPPTNSDDTEQVNRATTYGLGVAYRHKVHLLSADDVMEVGATARIDDIDQSDTRLLPDGTVNTRPVDAGIGATGIAGYVDAAVHPFPRFLVRGGTRFDSLAYSVDDHTGNQGLERTMQGLHVGNKATVDYAAGHGVHLVASYGEGFRSPNATGLVEGERIPFATIRSTEVGVRFKTPGGGPLAWQSSLVGFASWLSQDLVFDALSLSSLPAPSSRRAGGAAATTLRYGVLGVSASATYARATFTGSDDTFRSGDAVPYAPALVVRDDAFVLVPLPRTHASCRFGAGTQGAFGATLPGGAPAEPTFYVDALAAVSWKAFELAINGMNLLDRRYYDQELVYPANFGRSATLPAPTPHVLVAPPASVFATLKVRVGL
jgi:hypothetical protein